MDRILDGDADTMTQFFAAQQRAYVLSVISGEENFDPLDKTDRAEICPGTNLKLWDDVLLYGALKVRVICAAGGRDNFTSYRFDPESGGHTIESWCGTDSTITDRAPFDPNETPMPIVPEPEP